MVRYVKFLSDLYIIPVAPSYGGIFINLKKKNKSCAFPIRALSRDWQKEKEKSHVNVHNRTFYCEGLIYIYLYYVVG